MKDLAFQKDIILYYLQQKDSNSYPYAPESFVLKYPSKTVESNRNNFQQW